MIKPTSIRQAIVAIPAALMLTACDQYLTDANLREVKTEMTTKEVESILGPPRRVEGVQNAPSLSGLLNSSEQKTPTERQPVTRYIYEQDGRKVELTFAGDRLIPGGVSGSFEK